MRTAFSTFSALLFGMALLLLGNGLQGSLLSLRGAIEMFAPFTIGLIMAAYYVGFVYGCLTLKPLVVRVGHIRAFTALASLASACALIHALSVEPVSWIVLRAITGVCFAGLFLVVESWLNGRVQNQQRGTLMAVYMIVNLGSMAAAQQLLTVADPAGVVLFMISSALVSIAVVPVALTSSVAPSPVLSARLHLRQLYAMSPLGLAGAFTVGLTNGAMWALVPAAGFKLGMTTAEIAHLMTVIVLGGVVLQWPIGWLSDRFDRRRTILGVALALALASAAAYSVGKFDSAASLGLAFALGGCLLTLYPLCVAHVNDRIAPEDLVETTSALLLIFGLGAIAGPLIAAGAIAWRGSAMLFAYFFVVALAFAAFAIYRMRVSEAVPAAEQGPFEPVPPTPAAASFDPRGEPPPAKPPGVAP